MVKVSNATFDVLERMAKEHPELRGAFSRSTGGVDVDLVVVALLKSHQALGVKFIATAQAAEALEAEVVRLRGLQPELPPYPPEGHGLPRYGLRWNGPEHPLAVPMVDGYWTPHHLAIRQIRSIEAASEGQR
jgi:hypothetical protein